MSALLVPINNYFFPKSPKVGVDITLPTEMAEKIFSYIPNGQIAHSQSISKAWKKRCADHFNGEAKKITAAGFPIDANTWMRKGIHTIDELMSRVDRFASRLKPGDLCAFHAYFPFDLQNHLKVVVSRSEVKDDYDEVEKCVVVSKNLTGINPKVTVDFKTGFRKEFSFGNEVIGYSESHLSDGPLYALEMVGSVPQLDLSPAIISERCLRLENLIVDFFGPPLRMVLGEEFSNRFQSKFRLTIDKLPKDILLNKDITNPFLDSIQWMEENKKELILAFDDPKYTGDLCYFFLDLERVLDSILVHGGITGSVSGELRDLFERQRIPLYNTDEITSNIKKIVTKQMFREKPSRFKRVINWGARIMDRLEPYNRITNWIVISLGLNYFLRSYVFRRRD